MSDENYDTKMKWDQINKELDRLFAILRNDPNPEISKFCFQRITEIEDFYLIPKPIMVENGWIKANKKNGY